MLCRKGVKAIFHSTTTVTVTIQNLVLGYPSQHILSQNTSGCMAGLTPALVCVAAAGLLVAF